ncbi:SurA N-terminal domain-containing protein [Candidatus Tisiphia endosymbiont of Nemotelus uliginosus]|uniref:SurA N-terminal domain-containing protein n=1 Tax=Candidatus Tisiphia endosymbiont of Nemotelus uliginosus TaxID=3077926 RepID=UPI0035C8835B
MKKIFWLVIIILNITVAKAELPNIVALVNNEPITLNEFQARKHMIMALNNITASSTKDNKQIDTIAMNGLIDEALLCQSTKNQISESELNAAIESIEQRNKMSAGQLIEFLKSKAVDINSFKSQIRAEIIKSHILAGFSKSVTISPKEVNTIILATEARDAEISAQMFTSKNKEAKTLQKMYNLQKRLKNCDIVKPSLYADFATLETINQRLNTLDTTMQTLLRDLNIEEKSSVFETKDGFTVILMCNKKVLNITPDENNYILNFLTNKKISQKAQKFLDNMHKKAYIKIMLPL